MFKREVEFTPSELPPEAKSRYDYALELAPTILGAHPNITHVVLFAGIADGSAHPNSDVDIAMIYHLDHYDRYIHDEILQAFRLLQKQQTHEPFPIHLVIIPDSFIVEGSFPTSRNIRDKGVILCSR
jgi:predicted nucleotidyltransferase